MITNVTTNTNYNNYSLGFKGVKDKFKSVVVNSAAKITPKSTVVSPFTEEESKKLAQTRSIGHELLMLIDMQNGKYLKKK